MTVCMQEGLLAEGKGSEGTQHIPSKLREVHTKVKEFCHYCITL